MALLHDADRLVVAAGEDEQRHQPAHRVVALFGRGAVLLKQRQSLLDRLARELLQPVELEKVQRIFAVD